jgi:hypothetical protein
MRYPVVIHKDESSDFGVTIPDIPGCFSAGDTYDDALNKRLAQSRFFQGRVKQALGL